MQYIYVDSRSLAVLGIPTEEVVSPNHAFAPGIELAHRFLELFAAQPHAQLLDKLLHLVGVLAQRTCVDAVVKIQQCGSRFVCFY